MSVSDLGSLSHCMLENDAESRDRARNLRHKSLVISVVFETGLLGAMLLWPLITPGVLPGLYIMTPTPPYRGGGGAADKPAPSHTLPPANNEIRPVPCLYCAKPTAPTPARPFDGASVSSAGGDSAPGIGDGGMDGLPGPGVWIPGADGSGMPVEIKKPEPPAHKEPVRRSEGVMAAALIYKVQPKYPDLARMIHLQGTVYLRAIIATDGTVRQLEVISGNPMLANPALQAVREWRYQPTRLNGEAVEVETLITVNFVLNQQ
jgi:periplasmic protein TonB